MVISSPGPMSRSATSTLTRTCHHTNGLHSGRRRDSHVRGGDTDRRLTRVRAKGVEAPLVHRLPLAGSRSVTAVLAR